MNQLKETLSKGILLVSAGINSWATEGEETVIGEFLEFADHYAVVWSKILLSLTIFTLGFQPIVLDYSNSWLPELYTYEILKIGQMIFAFVAANTLQCYYYYKENMRAQMSREYDKIEKTLREYCRVEAFPKVSKVFKSLYWIYILVLITSIALEWAVHEHCEKFWQYVWWWYHLFEEIVCLSFIAQYIVIAKALTVSVKAWNEEISTLAHLTNPDVGFEAAAEDGMVERGRITGNFNTLKTIFELLHSSINNTSKFYSFPAFVVLVYNSYTVFVMAYTFVAQLKFGLGNGLALVYSAFWFALFISLQLTWVTGIEALLNQLAETPNKISELSEAFPNDDQSKIQVERFERWIRNEKVEFTAGGVISLNKKYLLSLLSFIGTWVVVFIEWYDPADHRKNSTKNETLTNSSFT